MACKEPSGSFYASSQGVASLLRIGESRDSKEEITGPWVRDISSASLTFVAAKHSSQALSMKPIGGGTALLDPHSQAAESQSAAQREPIQKLVKKYVICNDCVATTVIQSKGQRQPITSKRFVVSEESFLRVGTS